MAGAFRTIPFKILTFQELGLPYAADPAITKHLAAFLTSHRGVLADEVSGGVVSGE